MCLHPDAFVPRDAVLLIVPFFIAAASESARVDSEVPFDSTERESAVTNQPAQDRREVGVFKERRHLGTGNRLRDKARVVRFQQVSRESPGAKGSCWVAAPLSIRGEYLPNRIRCH